MIQPSVYLVQIRLIFTHMKIINKIKKLDISTLFVVVSILLLSVLYSPLSLIVREAIETAKKENNRNALGANFTCPENYKDFDSITRPCLVMA